MVKCSGCGFLALRGRDGGLIEASDEYREQGNESPASSWLPLCFVMVPDLRQESAKADRKMSLEVINRERNCLRFVKWQQGYSPKEHKEMQDTEKLREWQERQRRSDRRWNMGQAIFVVVLSAIISWAVGTFAARDKDQRPIHVHIDGSKNVDK